MTDVLNLTGKESKSELLAHLLLTFVQVLPLRLASSRSCQLLTDIEVAKYVRSYFRKEMM